MRKFVVLLAAVISQTNPLQLAHADGGVLVGDGYPKLAPKYTVTKTLPGHEQLLPQLQSLIARIAYDLPTVAYQLHRTLTNFTNPESHRYIFTLEIGSHSQNWSTYYASNDIDPSTLLPVEARVNFWSDFLNLSLFDDKELSPSQLKAVLHELCHIAFTGADEFSTSLMTERLYSMGRGINTTALNQAAIVKSSADVERKMIQLQKLQWTKTNLFPDESKRSFPVANPYFDKMIDWYTTTIGKQACSDFETKRISVAGRNFEAPRLNNYLFTRIKSKNDPFFQNYRDVCIPKTPDGKFFAFGRSDSESTSYLGTNPLLRDPHFILRFVSSNGTKIINISLAAWHLSTLSSNFGFQVDNYNYLKASFAKTAMEPSQPKLYYEDIAIDIYYGNIPVDGYENWLQALQDLYFVNPKIIRDYSWDGSETSILWAFSILGFTQSQSLKEGSILPTLPFLRINKVYNQVGSTTASCQNSLTSNESGTLDVRLFCSFEAARSLLVFYSSASSEMVEMKEGKWNPNQSRWANR